MRAKIIDLLIENENRMASSLDRFDAEFLDRMLADDFIEIGSSGKVYTKQDVLKSLGGGSQSDDIRLTGFEGSLLSPKSVLLRFTAEKSTSDGAKMSLRSSIWVLREGAWQCVFQQGTPVIQIA